MKIAVLPGDGIGKEIVAETLKVLARLALKFEFEEAPVGLATVVLIATDWPRDLERTLAGLRAHTPEGTSVVVVADAPSEAQEKRLSTRARRRRSFGPASGSGPGRRSTPGSGELSGRSSS